MAASSRPPPPPARSAEPRSSVYTLSARDLTATDGSPVNGTAIVLPRMASRVVASHVVTTSGSPTGYDMRAAIEVSFDGGTTWHQVLRFKDITNAAALSQTVRCGANTTLSEDIATSSLGTTASTAVTTQLPWASMMRAVTKLQTLTGGTAPHILSSVLLEAA